MRQQLPEYMVPAAFTVMERLPLTTNGKVDRKALPPPASAQQETAYEPAANPTESMLIALWEEILDARRIGANDHFFEIGGHSLKAMLLASELQKRTAIPVSVQDIFAHPTVRELAARLEEVVTDQVCEAVDEADYITSDKNAAQLFADEVVPIPIADAYPASSMQERLYIAQQLENAGTAYNMPITIELRGALDREKLHLSFARLLPATKVCAHRSR